MFLRHYNTIIALARPEGLPVPTAAGAAREWAQAGAHLALRRELTDMPLSRRLADPAAYLALQRGRRQALEALTPVEADAPALERVVDLICMICEESAWSENVKGAPFDDEQHPEIDFQCAETLMLLAWVSRALGERLGSRVTGKLVYEARRRVFSPFLAHGDYPFMRGVGPRAALCRRPLCILADILLSAILLEPDAARRGAVIKQALRMIDQAIQGRDARVAALEDELAETAAVTDLCALLRKLTRGEADLTRIYPTADWLDALLFPWLVKDCFADPAAGGMRPKLSGQELFRVGLACSDEALTALGAALHRMGRRPSATVTGRFLDLGCAGMLSATNDAPPRLKHAATARNRIMVSRFAGMTACLHTGGRRGNAGTLTLFCGDRPILVECPGCADVPLISGVDQLADAGERAPEAAFGAEACPADFEAEPDRELMSVDLTNAWPQRVGARSIQRTAMALRRDSALRLVDAFDLETALPVVFRFYTPQRPERLLNGLRLGPVDMTWEDELRCDTAPMDARFPDEGGEGLPLYRVTFATPKPVSRAYFTFWFSVSQG